MDAVLSAWAHDRSLGHRLGAAFAERDRSCLLVPWLASKTVSLDELYLATWIVDRCHLPGDHGLHAAALFIAHKFHCTCPETRLSRFVAGWDLRTTPARLKIDEHRLGIHFKYSFSNAAITDHIYSLLRVACKHQYVASRRVQQSVITLLTRYRCMALSDLAMCAVLASMGVDEVPAPLRSMPFDMVVVKRLTRERREQPRACT